MSHQKTLQQERAAQAYQDIEDSFKALGKKELQKEYASLIKGLPAFILGDGFAETLAFLKAKGKDKQTDRHEMVYNHLSSWVMKKVAKKEGKLLEWLLAEDSFKYRQATIEALAYLSWLKRFAEAKGIGE